MSQVAPAPPQMQRDEPGLDDPAGCPCLKLSELREGDLILLMSRSFAGNFIGTFGTGISHIGIVVEYGGKLWLAQSVTNPLSMGAKQMIAIADLPSPLREARSHNTLTHPRARIGARARTFFHQRTPELRRAYRPPPGTRKTMSASLGARVRARLRLSRHRRAQAAGKPAAANGIHAACIEETPLPPPISRI